MPTQYKGISINIGIDKKPDYLSSNLNLRLKGCKNDAEFMAKLAEINGFGKIKRLMDGNATRQNVIKELKNAKNELATDGILLITYAGHGGQLPQPPPATEPDRKNEYWAFYDDIFLDDELNFLYLNQFSESQRIVVISDSCHSGTIIDDYIPLIERFVNNLNNQLLENEQKIDFQKAFNAILHSIGFDKDYDKVEWEKNCEFISKRLKTNLEKETFTFFRTLPIEVLLDKDLAAKVHHHRNNLEKEIGKNNTILESLRVNKIGISACQDGELAIEGFNEPYNKWHGLFTKFLIQVLIEKNQISLSEEGDPVLISGAQALNYPQLHAAIRIKSNKTRQDPNYFPLNSHFQTQRCFTI